MEIKHRLHSLKCIAKRLLYMCNIIIRSIYLSLVTLAKGERAIFDCEINKEVIILGNGPSLNDIDLDALSKEEIEIACVNSFPVRNAYFEILKPRYLVLLDPAYFANSDQMEQEVKELYEVLNKVEWNMHVIIPQTEKLPINNDNLTVDRLCVTTLNADCLLGYLDWFYRHNLLCVGYQNVVIGAGYYFVSRRVKRLYFAGIDMSEFKQLFVDEQNRVYVDAIHNYGSERRYSTLFDKGEFYKLLELYQIMFKQFAYLKKYADRQQVETINLSTQSYVDVFEKSTLFHKQP